jgi:hypothetical protein
MQAFLYNSRIRFSDTGVNTDQKSMNLTQSVSTETPFSSVTYTNSDKFFFVWVPFLCLSIAVFPSRIIYQIHFFDLFLHQIMQIKTYLTLCQKTGNRKEYSPLSVAIWVACAALIVLANQKGWNLDNRVKYPAFTVVICGIVGHQLLLLIRNANLLK